MHDKAVARRFALRSTRFRRVSEITFAVVFGKWHGVKRAKQQSAQNMDCCLA